MAGNRHRMPTESRAAVDLAGVVGCAVEPKERDVPRDVAFSGPERRRGSRFLRKPESADRVLGSMPELENPVENPCFGCGPFHPRGLRLRFETTSTEDGQEEVLAKFVPKADEVGWPTLFHHGLHFTVLYETAYWTALTLGGKLWVSGGPLTYTADRLPRVGVEHVARGRIVRSDPDRLTIRSTTATANGKPCGTLESTWSPARRAVVERAGIPLPEYLARELSP